MHYRTRTLSDESTGIRLRGEKKRDRNEWQKDET